MPCAVAPRLRPARRRFAVQLAMAMIVCAVAALDRPAAAFEPGSTHAGLTGKAALRSKLHRLLRKRGYRLGLLTRLQLQPGLIPRRKLRRLRLQLKRLDPAGGYRPDAELGQWALGWLMAGAVLQGTPAVTDRDHFFNPVTRKGLRDRRPLLGGVLSVLSTLEGGDSIRALLTGTGFDLTGMSALRWIRSRYNEHSVARFYNALRLSVRAERPDDRAHYLSTALMALGGLLHVLQDMASPTHVRDDYAVGHLQQLGRSVFNLGSSYERYVAEKFGRTALPDYAGEPIRRASIRAYFTTKRWNGLADITHSHSFSPGTVPPPVQLVAGSDARELRGRLGKKLRFSAPALGRFHLHCARRNTCYVRGSNGPLLAYRITDERELVFFVDYRCMAATARQLLPLAVGFSTGLIDHLLRGDVSLRWTDSGSARIDNGALPLKAQRLSWLAEDRSGGRSLVATRDLHGRWVKARSKLLSDAVQLPSGAVKLVALIEGKDRAGDPVVLSAAVDIPGAASQPAPAATQPSAPTSAPARPATTRPTAATAPATSKPTKTIGTSPTIKPATSKPATSKPATNKPAAVKSRPAAAKPPATKRRPAATQPAATQPGAHGRPSSGPARTSDRPTD